MLLVSKSCQIRMSLLRMLERRNFWINGTMEKVCQEQWRRHTLVKLLDSSACAAGNHFQPQTECKKEMTNKAATASKIENGNDPLHFTIVIIIKVKKNQCTTFWTCPLIVSWSVPTPRFAPRLDWEAVDGFWSSHLKIPTKVLQYMKHATSQQLRIIENKL